MTGDITKAELETMIEVQSKSAQQMERIATSLAGIVESQKKVTECLGDFKNCSKSISTMYGDMKYVKWILTALASVIGLGLIIIELIKQLN